MHLLITGSSYIKHINIYINFSYPFPHSLITPYKKLQQQVRAGDVGQVKFIRLTSRDHPPPNIAVLSESGTFFDDFSTHDVDMAR